MLRKAPQRMTDRLKKVCPIVGGLHENLPAADELSVQEEPGVVQDVTSFLAEPNNGRLISCEIGLWMRLGFAMLSGCRDGSAYTKRPVALGKSVSESCKPVSLSFLRKVDGWEGLSQHTEEFVAHIHLTLKKPVVDMPRSPADIQRSVAPARLVTLVLTRLDVRINLVVELANHVLPTRHTKRLLSMGHAVLSRSHA